MVFNLWCFDIFNKEMDWFIDKLCINILIGILENVFSVIVFRVFLILY